MSSYADYIIAKWFVKILDLTQNAPICFKILTFDSENVSFQGKDVKNNSFNARFANYWAYSRCNLIKEQTFCDCFSELNYSKKKFVPKTKNRPKTDVPFAKSEPVYKKYWWEMIN